MAQPVGGSHSNSAQKSKFASSGPSADRPPGFAPLRSQPTIFRAMNVEGLLRSNPVQPAPETSKSRNIVIFGDSGVGKSSLINMLAGTKTAETSNGVLGCTFQSSQHTIDFDGDNLHVWDTAGLDEGTRGRVPPEVAERNLKKLLRELRKANGVHLLVYCMRGASIRKSLARNYVIFYSAICRKKVPIVAVVTGLENEEPAMEDWWVNGEKELAKYKMRFDDYACVTTLNLDKYKGTPFEDRIRLSQQLVRRLISDNCRRATTQRLANPNVFMKTALRDVRSVMRFGLENAEPLCSVVFYQTDTPSPLQPSLSGDAGQLIGPQVNGRSLEFHYAGDLTGRFITPKIPKGGADLLIFSGTPSGLNKERFRQFYARCGGEMCPMLVVTNSDDWAVNAWKDYLDEQRISAQVVPVPSEQDFYDLIEELSLVRGPTGSRMTKLLRVFRRKIEPPPPPSAPLRPYASVPTKNKAID